MPPIDMGRFRLRARESGIPPARQQTPPRPRSGEHFLKGPIPLDWLSSAARLPGKSLHVGIALWFMGGMQKSRVVPLSNITSLRFGLDRNAKYRGLGWLEGAGLIAVERKLGRAPIITLNDVPFSHPGEPT